MPDERTAETPPGTPGQRALGAMESAVRRARESAGAPPLSRPPPEDRHPPGPTGETAPPARPDRWLIGTVAVVAVLVVAAAIALIVSSSSSTAPPSPAAAPSGQAPTAPTHSPSTGPRNGAAPATTPTTSTPTPSTTTTVAVAPAGPPVISSLSPASGSAGQSVMVSGANFLSTSGQIVATFNGQVAPTSCPAQNTCTVTVPSSNAPSAQVVITTAGGASNAETFTYS